MPQPPLLPPSPSGSIEQLAEELASTVDQLKTLGASNVITLPQALTATEPLLRLRHTFIDNERPQTAKDAFRHLLGFQTLLDLMHKLAELYDTESLPKDESKSLLGVYKDVLGVLAEGLRDHYGNKRYFARRIAGGGTAALERTLALLAGKIDNAESDAQQLYGAVLAAALCQETVASIFLTLSAKFPQGKSPGSPNVYRAAVDQCLGSAETIEVADLLGVLVRVWVKHSASLEHDTLRLALPACLCQLVSQSRRNVVALHATGMLTSILALLFDNSRSETERALYQELARYLSVQGMGTLDDAVALYRQAHDSPQVLKFLLTALKYSKEPPSIQFDLSLHGFCSVEFATLNRPFPPSASAGYTLAVWVRFDEFDVNTHTTIFGAFDASQTCFLLAYLERNTRNFILQTSIRGPRPSVRFKSTKFEPGRWYHICLVHKRPKHASSSRASLFVDGEFVEQSKIEYPSTPSSSHPHKPPRIQAFFGTPQDLAMRLGKGVATSRWSLANGILYDETFSDDMVAVFYNLGPRYFGNFQDCLGSFQTYKASATLNLRNEHLHPGKEESSDIVTAIRRRASSLVHESSILVNVSPVAVLDDDDSNNVNESQLIKRLSRQAAKSLRQLTKAGGNAVAVNGATPAINDGLTQPQGVGVLTGDPVVAVPRSLDDASWCLGGCTAVHLSLIQAADCAETTLLAVEALYEAVQDNWRNSEAMERENGYGILAVLLREKLGFQSGSSTPQYRAAPVGTSVEEQKNLAFDILRLTLSFVGYDFERPSRSIITNPLAYRVLLVDMDIWRLGELPVLDLYYSQFQTFASVYYSQFRTFASDSNYRRFNARRLGRMRVNKKLLETLKEGELTHETLQPCLSAFRSLMESNLSPDLLRSLALSITYTLHRPKQPASLRKKKSLRFAAASSRPGSSKSSNSDKYLSNVALGTEMMRLYSAVLCNPLDPAPLRKFAKAVTNKWLLYLVCEDEPEVVVLAAKVLARLLVVHGNSYTKKFTEKNGGYTVMKHYLNRWWNIPVLWPICFSILFGQDIALLELDRPFNAQGLLDIFVVGSELHIVHPEMLSVITEMLKSGLKSIVLADGPTNDQSLASANALGTNMSKTPSCNLDEVALPDRHAHGPSMLSAVVMFLAEARSRSRNFQDFTAQSSYVHELLCILYPAVFGTNPISPNAEVTSRDSELGFDESNLVLRPHLTTANTSTSLQATTVECSSGPDDSTDSLRRGSSFILLSSDKAKHQPSSARVRHIVNPRFAAEGTAADHPLVKAIVGLALAVFEDQLLHRKDFAGLALYQRTPPGVLEHQAYFNSWVFNRLLSTLQDIPTAKPRLLQEPRTLTNLGRFATHLAEAVFEGWYIDGAAATLECFGTILEYLQRPDISPLKSVRLCNQALATMHSTLYRVVLLQLSKSEDGEALSVLKRLNYWQVVLLAAAETQPKNLQLLCYLLYTKLVSGEHLVRLAAASLWRIILVQKPDEMTSLLSHGPVALQRRLADGFDALMGMEDEAFLQWIDDERDDLDTLFFGILSRAWDTFVHDENAKSEESARSRSVKRKDRLRQWAHLEKFDEDVIRKHDATLPHWISNISASEFLKSQRFWQDLQDNSVFMWTAFSNMLLDLRRSGGLLADGKERKWRLDQTEGRSRMRRRVFPDDSGERQDYQPKRKASELPAVKIDTRVRALSAGEAVSTPTPLVPEPESVETPDHQDGDADDRSMLEENFEMIDDPKLELEDYEDKNRKVMRSLHRGDQVQNVYNMSRIIGLEAVEGLLILGKDCIYILDNFFQRADGEIVNVWQAPSEERDPYVRMIAGRESNDRRSHEHETRSWKWTDLVSVSKRRFLFRDVALEIFFTDGTSYLLTSFSARVRDDLCNQLGHKAPQVTGSVGHSRPEDIWRYETLRSQEDEPKSLGSKFASVFGHLSSNPATRKWVRGEISNFHYLMLINTLAGRTFNDLTQYPVFPWVLADYTSEELDLNNPKTFRDLSKPMGCQTPGRQAEFRERYNAFAEMADDNSPPFHYGTHYSSAMIVTSYLIRLQPFVKSYLLLQGGTFDHADRLFYSIRKAWESASRGNMSDVRELIPEFFYLPEFLVNANKYDFGLLQNMTTAIDSVELPPWAKGDPKIFIEKHREALESPYVSENLHRWIDLVFGSKQKGEAAVEAVNVFHHLSYKGAKNLDAIDDPMERLATIGIIHNFGQTPHQIFQRNHPQREDQRYRVSRLDTLAESLTQMPLSLLDIEERVSTLSMKHDRLLCTAALRLNVPPNFDHYMEWGFFDGSVRFYAADSRKILGHFEHLHIGQLSHASFADSRTLVTCGTDCTISLWTVTATSRSVDLQPIGSLFGHRAPVTVLAVSRSFSTMLSASSDGRIMLWDLNRRCFVRAIPADGLVDCARINDVTGDIVVCRGNRITMYTLNGEILVDQPVCDSPDDHVLSCVFYEGVQNEWLERELVLTGHSRGVVNIWSKTIRGAQFELELIRQLHHTDSSRDTGANISAGISCILALPHVVYTGDEVGRVYEWNCVQRR